MAKIGNYFLFTLLFLWQLPQNLVALGLLLCCGKVQFITYRHYCIGLSGRLPSQAGGISLGNFAIISPDCTHNDEILRHEIDGHTFDSKIFGPLYLLVIGLPSVLHLLWYVRKRPTNKTYDDFYTERWANRHAGLE